MCFGGHICNQKQLFSTICNSIFHKLLQNQVHKEPENIIDGQELALKYETHVKEFFKYEESLLKENGKVGMKYSCLLCLPVIKVLITNKNPLPCLSGHVKSVHSQFFPKFEVATQTLMPPGEPKLPIEAPFICPDCKEEFQSHESLKAHWQVSHKKRDDKNKTLLCNLCGRTLARNDSLTRHLWNEHKLGKSRMSCKRVSHLFTNLAYIPHIKQNQ